MPRFAANLTMQYNEHPFLDRFAAAAADGFTAVEYMFPYDFPKEDIRARLDEHKLEQVLFNAPAGDWAAGDRGIAAVPGREAECRAGVDKALDYAATLGTKLVHVMAGIGGGEAARAAYIANLDYAADRAARQGVTIVIEPINRRDMPGFFVDRQADAQAIRAEIGRDNLKILFDCYHAQVAEGDLATKLRRDIAQIGHIQIAGPPGRNEPDTGEIDFPYLFGVIDEIGYAGWIGCEYRPAKGTSEGLGWLKRARAAGDTM